MYKIKKPHKCGNHLAPVTKLFLGFENQPLAILEKDRQVAKFGMLVQCTMCKIIGVVPLAEEKPEPEVPEPEVPEPEHKCDCGKEETNICACKDKNAEREKTKEK